MDGKTGIYLQCPAVTAATQRSHCSSWCLTMKLLGKPGQIKATLCAAQQLLAEQSTAQLFYKEVPELPPLILGLSLSFPAFPWRHLMQILKNLSTPQEYRGIKHGAFNISLDFCKTHQSHKDSEFWGTLKTMSGTIWKGPAKNVSSGRFSYKKYKGIESRWAEKHASRKTCQ